MRIGDLKSWCHHYPARWVANCLPVSLLGPWGSLLGRIEYMTTRPTNLAKLRTNLAAALGLQPESEEVFALSRAVLRHYAWNILEYGQAHRLRKAHGDRFIEIIGLERAEAALNDGRGLLIVGGHLATFEFSVAALAPTGRRCALIEQPETLPERMPPGFRRSVQRYRHAQQRRHLGYETICTGPDFYRAVRLLREGGVVGIATDIGLGSAIQHRFLGAERRIPLGPAYLALKTNADVVITHLERLSFGHNRFTLTPMPITRTGNMREDLCRLAAAIAAEYERLILVHPEQWAWFMWARISDKPEAADGSKGSEIG